MKWIKLMYISCGSIAVALGFLGIFLPLLPTTPFLLLGAACYLRGSNRLYQWLIHHKWLGKYIENYSSGNGITVRSKTIAITILWISILNSIFFLSIVLPAARAHLCMCSTYILYKTC